MNSNSLISQHKRILKLIDDTSSSTDFNLELQGHWGKYLSILVAGFLENAISIVYTDFVSSAASDHVIQYSQYHLDRIQNPKSKKFMDTASLFKKEWGDGLKQYFEEHPECKEAIDSIMNTRNQVAHGRQTSISVHRVRDYLEKSVSVIEFIENQCTNN